MCHVSMMNGVCGINFSKSFWFTDTKRNSMKKMSMSSGFKCLNSAEESSLFTSNYVGISKRNHLGALKPLRGSKKRTSHKVWHILHPHPCQVFLLNTKHMSTKPFFLQSAVHLINGKLASSFACGHANVGMVQFTRTPNILISNTGHMLVPVVLRAHHQQWHHYCAQWAQLWTDRFLLLHAFSLTTSLVNGYSLSFICD